MELTVRLPRPHGKQAAFRSSPAKRKVIVAGRRGGKTTGAAMIACEAMLKGRRVLEAAPTQDQTNAFWDLCKEWLAEPIHAGVVYKNESRHLLEMPNGARIRTKTAWDADSLRGDYADLLILDEFSIMDPSTWNVVGAPMLLDNDGDAVFIFTPKRRNHAFALYTEAMTDDTDRWGAWHFTSYDNPHLSRVALDEITRDMTEEAHQQEILAQFLENEGTVFRNIAACLYPGGDTPEMHAGHSLIMGVDWGKQNDYTVMSIGCRDCKREVELERFNIIDYRIQRQRLKAAAERWGVEEIMAESNAMGEPNIEELQYAGLPVTPFNTSSTSKPPLIESLRLCFENEEGQWIDNPTATAELEAYEMKVNANTGRPTFSAPDGVHDDTVMARALMWQLVFVRGAWMTLLGADA